MSYTELKHDGMHLSIGAVTQPDVKRSYSFHPEVNYFPRMAHPEMFWSFCTVPMLAICYLLIKKISFLLLFSNIKS